jgi:methionine sulfoxide reductase heme-binding subunit
MSYRVWTIGHVKVVLFLACLMPFGLLLGDAFMQDLGANPIEAIIHRTGDWTLRLLLVTLSMTPLKIVTGNASWIRYRRMLGLFVFFYACLHLASYIVLDQFFDWGEIINDIIKHPYITVGMLAWLIMLPLAITSTKGMMKRMGRAWKRLHKLVYVAAIAGVIHYIWLVKADLREPLLYAFILAFLLLIRFLHWSRQRMVSNAFG